MAAGPGGVLDQGRGVDSLVQEMGPGAGCFTCSFLSWFTGGLVNTCYNLLDVHVENGRAEQVALIYDSPVTGIVKSYTYRELLNEVALFAGALRQQGVEKGERVIIYMPMVPEAVIAMLACARIGAVHSVVFGGFAADELATRI